MGIVSSLFKYYQFNKHSSLSNEQLSNNLQNAIQLELKFAFQNINKLANSDPQFKNSDAYKALIYLFNEMQNDLPQIKGNSSHIIQSLLNKINQVSFYTNPGNSGTGFNPKTRMGNEYSPGSYLDRIKTHLINFSKLIH